MAKPDRAERVVRAARRLGRLFLWDRYAEEDHFAVAVSRLVEREVKRAVEECAQIAEARAEYLKHTSHADGLGFGDHRGESACAWIAAAIRARK